MVTYKNVHAETACFILLCEQTIFAVDMSYMQMLVYRAQEMCHILLVVIKKQGLEQLTSLLVCVVSVQTDLSQQLMKYKQQMEVC